MQCQKCYKNLQECQACGGRSGPGTGRTCSRCSNSGMLCPSHGGFWKR